ncbi:hypothetical protein N7540_009480 [Penicillium herquei]|nr:hypothetical protein N7540_009480 [Penicillium herquei]
MDSYLSFPIIDAFITFVDEKSDFENNLKALLNSLLNHEFPLTMGYGTAALLRRKASYPDFKVFHLQSLSLSDRGIVDHVLVEAKHPDERLEDTISQLITALESANTEHGRCWAIMVNGTAFSFYEYHANFPVSHRLIPWCPLGQSTNTFNLRRDPQVIESIFDHMRQKNEPPAR